MGSYDIVKFEEPIKCKCGKEVEDFQTKQFECFSNMIYITKKGRWKEESFQWHQPGKSKKEDRFWMERKHIGWKYPKPTVTIYCYAICSDYKCSKWIDVKAVFIDGKLQKKKVTYNAKYKT